MKKLPCPSCGFDVVSIPKNVGVVLRRERMRLKMEAGDVARRMGVSGAYLCMLENGGRKFTHDLIHRYKAALK